VDDEPVCDAALLSGGWPTADRLGPALIMALSRSVADVLSRHVRFEVERIDRMDLNVHVGQR
ncbi:MAG: hypothetical protein ACQSGP_28840, partial [Frankia sp.]